MGITKLRGLLRPHVRVALDTSIFIYQLQAHPKYVDLTNQIFAWLERLNHQGITSTITMTELLAQPYRNRNRQRADGIYGLLSTFPNLAWLPPSLDIADLAAQIRAEHGLRTPDALHASTAIRNSATAFVTNDRIFLRIKGIQIVVLDDLI